MMASKHFAFGFSTMLVGYYESWGLFPVETGIL